MIRPLTQGSWLVTGIAGVDTETDIIYFTATKAGPDETHLYAVSLMGGDIRRITQVDGTHAATSNQDKKLFIDTHHNRETPPTIVVRSLETGEVVQNVFEGEKRPFC